MGVRSQTRNSSRLLLHAVAASGRADIAASIAKSRPEQQRAGRLTSIAMKFSLRSALHKPR